MSLDCAERVQLAFGSEISAVGFFGRSKVSQMLAFAINLYASRITIIACLVDTKKASFILLVRLPLVLYLTNFGNFAQICNRIVATVTVYVVNLFSRPSAMNMEPRKPVRSVCNSKEPNGNVAFVTNRSGNVPDSFVSSRTLFYPSKDSSIWIVIKIFAHCLRDKLRLVHMPILPAF